MTETFYITKCALTKGIRTIQGEISPEWPNLVSSGSGFDNHHFHGEGRQWHRTMEGAITKAEQMRKAKIASLFKQISKLEQLSFTQPKP